jgi:hypothetical protein
MKLKGSLTTTGVGSYDFSAPIPFNSILKAVWAYEGAGGYSAHGGVPDAVDLQYGAPGVAPTTLLTAGNWMFNFPNSSLATNVATALALDTIIPVALPGAAAATVSVTVGGYGVANITSTVGNPPVFVRGGILKIVVEAISTTAGSDLTVVCEVARSRQGCNWEPVETGTYGTDSDIF